MPSFEHVSHSNFSLCSGDGFARCVTEKIKTTQSFSTQSNSGEKCVKSKLVPPSLVSLGGRHLELGIHTDTGPARPTC